MTCFDSLCLGSIEIQSEEDADGTVMFFGVVPQCKMSTLNLDTHSEVSFSNPQSSYVDYVQEDE